MKNILWLIPLFLNSIVFGQIYDKEKMQLKFDSLSKVDFLKYNYSCLDESHKIIMDSVLFNQVLNDYHFEQHPKNHSDSLTVVLIYELDDWDAERFARISILFSWERLGLYLHKTEAEAKKLGQELGFKEPYYAYLYLRKQREFDFILDKKIRDREIERIKNLLLKKSTNSREDLNKLSNRELLNLSFYYNPIVLEWRRKHVESHKKMHPY